MRLLIVTREKTGERGYGLGKTVGAIAQELLRRGHDVFYFSAEGWNTHEKKRMEQIEFFLIKALFWSKGKMISRAWSERLLQGWRAAGEAMKQKVTHVWFQDPWLVAGFWFRMLRHKKISIPYRWGISEHGLGSFESAVSYDGLFIDSRLRQWLKKYERTVTSKAHWVWSPTHCAMRQLLIDLGYTSVPENWHVMGYGLPVLSHVSRTEARRALGWDAETVYVISIGRITPAKGMDKVVKAFGYVKKKSHIKTKLIILGDGERQWLEEVAYAHGINVEMGFITDITYHLYAADIYISGGAVESFGYANLEALSSGIASIIVRGGANEEVAGKGAWIVENEELDIALLELVQNPTARKKWSECALHYVRGYPRWEEIGSLYEQYLVK